MAYVDNEDENRSWERKDDCTDLVEVDEFIFAWGFGGAMGNLDPLFCLLVDKGDGI